MLETCLFVMGPRLYCDCEVIGNLPNINDGEDEDEEAESPHQGYCCILVQTSIDSLACLLPLKWTACFTNLLFNFCLFYKPSRFS